MGCPGSPPYSIHEDGIVTVNGAVPQVSGSQLSKMQAAWQRWGRAILAAASREQIPPAWLLGVMMQESGGDPTACSPCGGTCCSSHLGRRCCAFGLMQLIPNTAVQQKSSAEQMLLDPIASLNAGASLLRGLLDKYGWDFVMATAAYNAGTPRCGASNTFGYVADGDYSYNVIRWSNAAIRSLELTAPKISAPAVVASMGFVTAALIFTDVLKLKWI